MIIKNDTPITGVCDINAATYLSDDIAYHSIDTFFEEHLKECANDEHDDCFYHDSCDGYIIGFKKNESTGLYDIDETKDYTAIMNETTIQIVHSKYVSYCGLCSPCYPGQGDLSTRGNYLTFALPLELYDDEFNEHLPILKLSDIKKEEW